MLPLHRWFRAAARLGRSKRARWGLALLALVLAVTAGVRERASGAVTLDGVTFHDDGTSLIVEATVTNGTMRRAFVYDQRALGHEFDEDSGTLTLVMHTVPRPPTGSSADCHVMLPSTREVGALRSADLRLKVPRRPKTWVPGGPPREHPVPTHVRLELGWSDEPITLHRGEQSLCTFDAGTRLQGRERGILVGTSP